MCLYFLRNLTVSCLLLCLEAGGWCWYLFPHCSLPCFEPGTHPWALEPTYLPSSALGLQTLRAAALGIENTLTRGAISPATKLEDFRKQRQGWNYFHISPHCTQTPKATYTKDSRMQSWWHKALHSEDIPWPKLLDAKLRSFKLLLFIRTKAKILQSSGESLQCVTLWERISYSLCSSCFLLCPWRFGTSQSLTMLFIF